MPLRNLILLCALLSGALFLSACAGARSTSTPPAVQPATADASPRARAAASNDGIKPYNQVITAEARSDSGLFVVHRVGEKLFFEIPDSLLNREMLLSSRIARTAANLGYGGQESGRHVVRWQRNENQVFLRTVTYQSVANDSLPIYEAVRNASFEPIVRAFKIEARNTDTTAVVIDVTDLYTKDVQMMGLPSQRREALRVRRLDEGRSYLVRANSYPLNVEVRHVLTYEAANPPSQQHTGTVSLEMHQSMILLPKVPVQPRIWDERVGYFRVQQVDYGLDEQRAETRRYILRWHLEPSDWEAWERGELVEPVNPIVYYIDPATPHKWRPYLKQGVEDWQVAFEAAGFKNAIIAKDPPSPEEDPAFTPEDIRYSVIRYFPSQTQNAYGPNINDPRSGQIINADIGWYHNVMNLLRNWYFVQTAAANPKARGVRFDDEVMGELIRFVAAHEVGHTIGLPHNMKASAAYPVDSLRSATFTKKMGTAPSIMDYARFNYVAQPQDEGVSFMPNVGPYDIYAVKWGYRPIPGADSPEAERPTLDAWIRAREGDPMYQFGDLSSIDPTSQREDLGDDPVKASAYGVANLKRIVPNLVEWTYQEGEGFSQLREIYGHVVTQWGRYMGHVTTSIGGFTRTRKTFDQGGPVFDVVSRERQKESLAFLAEQAFATPEWLIERSVLTRIEDAGAVERIRTLQVNTLDNLLDPARMQRLIDAEAMNGSANAYTLGEMLADTRRAVWSELRGSNSIDLYRRNLQRGYIERMAFLMNEEPSQPPAAARRAFGLTEVNVSQSDIRPMVRGELQDLKREIRTALNRTSDRMTRLHLEDAMARIDSILDP